MKHSRGAHVAKFGVILIVALAVFGSIVMLLWNWLVPVLFSGPTITYWQALGLLLLSRLLFGGLRPRGPFGHGHHHPGHPLHRMHWSRMTREEREKVRENLRQYRRGFCGPRTADEPPKPEAQV